MPSLAAITALSHKIAYWPLDESAGATTAIDYSGNGRDLTVTGGVTFGVAGQSGTAAQFDGSTGYLSRNDSVLGADINSTADPNWTVLALVKGAAQAAKWVFTLSSTTDNDPMLGMGTGSVATASLRGRMRNTSGSATSDNTAADANAFDDGWHLLVYRRSASVFSLLVDGYTVFSTAAGGLSATNVDRTAIGAIVQAAVSAFFTGSIQHVLMTNDGVTDAEIEDIYEEAFGHALPSTFEARYVNPATGSDSNLGITTAAPYASAAKARSYAASHAGIVDHVYIDTSAAPLYLTGTVSFSANAGVTLNVQSINADTDDDERADIRAWELVAGATAVPFDTRYPAEASRPNLWVLVTRANAHIYEFMGGRGDNLKWFDHVVKLGTSSATWNNATNLSRLDANPWTFWTGSDGSATVTIFNPNGSPNGRDFAVTRFTGDCFNSVADTGPAIVWKNLLIGGCGGTDSTGTAVPGYPLRCDNGGTARRCEPYAGGTHNFGLFEVGTNTAEDCVLGMGPGWITGGSFSSLVAFTGSTVSADAHVLRRCTVGAKQSVRGSTTGASTKGNGFNGLFSHHSGAGLPPLTIEDCDFDGAIAIGSDATITGTIASNFTSAGSPTVTIDGCDFDYEPISLTASGADVTATNSIFVVSNASLGQSLVPSVAGTLVYGRCTFVVTTGAATAGNSSIMYRGGTLALTVKNCALDLINDSGVNLNLIEDMDIDAGDTLDLHHNVYRKTTTTGTILVSANIGAVDQNWTLAQLQALGYETGSQMVTAELFEDSPVGYPVPGSAVIGATADDGPMVDYTGVEFEVRDDAGAYEYIPVLSASKGHFAGGLAGGLLTDTGRLLPSRVVG